MAFIIAILEEMMSLLELPIGTRARVVSIHGGMAKRRVISLGLREGDEIELLYKGAFGGPVLVKNLSNGSQIAVGRGMASKIFVAPL